MKIYLIVDLSTLQVASNYIAIDAMQDKFGGPWGDPELFAHIPMPHGLDPECCSVSSELVVTANLDSIAAKQAAMLQALIQKRVFAAMEFGRVLMSQYGASNILAGFNMEQIKDVMARTVKLQAAIQSGSLYVALDELAALETDEVVITPARVTVFRHTIQDYLGIPRT